MLKALYILKPHAFHMIYGPAEQAEIGRLVDVIAPHQTSESVLKRPDLLAQVDIIFSGWGAPLMDRKFLEQTPNLKAVFYGSGSVRTFVTDDFWAKGIVLSNASAANAVPVSEFTLASILLSLKLTWRWAAANKGLTTPPNRADIPGVYGSTVGMISLGKIGRLVLERLKPFNLKVVVYDPFLQEEEAAELNVELASLNEVFRRADVVSLHTPLLPETVGMIREEHFAAMKPNATFINTARGAIVDEPGLISVLQKRPDIQALLDVTYPEPPIEGSPFYSLPNVTLTPHIAGSVNDECRRMGQYMIEELKCYLSHQPMQWTLCKESAAILA
jgi:phosphoglycerate dehydrogenase-like enzyme